MKTNILFIADESGSMQSCWDSSISSFNEYVTDVKDGLEGEARMTFVKFNTAVSTVYERLELDDVPTLDRDSYTPGGMTALYDAVGTSALKLEKELEKEDRALVIIMTDGHENSSREYNQRQINDLISRLEGKGNWTFVFLGANQDSWATGGSLGIKQGNIANYSQTDEGTRSAAKGMAYGTRMRSQSPLAATSTFLADAGVSLKEDGTVDESTLEKSDELTKKRP